MLADYAIARHYPEARSADDPYWAFFDAVVAALAKLTARWMLVGFIHGVLNTDNTTISGETIDYGPCASMDAYDPDKVFSSIDQFGRYAFSNQPAVMKWNLARFGETLLPVMEDGADKAIEAATASISRFDVHYRLAYAAGFRRKLGLEQEVEGDLDLAADLLDRMARNHADFTLTFRYVSEAAEDSGRDADVRSLFESPTILTTGLRVGVNVCREKISLRKRALRKCAASTRCLFLVTTGWKRPSLTQKPDASNDSMSF